MKRRLAHAGRRASPYPLTTVLRGGEARRAGRDRPERERRYSLIEAESRSARRACSSKASALASSSRACTAKGGDFKIASKSATLGAAGSSSRGGGWASTVTRLGSIEPVRATRAVPRDAVAELGRCQGGCLTLLPRVADQAPSQLLHRRRPLVRRRAEVAVCHSGHGAPLRPLLVRRRGDTLLQRTPALAPAGSNSSAVEPELELEL